MDLEIINRTIGSHSPDYTIARNNVANSRAHSLKKEKLLSLDQMKDDASKKPRGSKYKIALISSPNNQKKSILKRKLPSKDIILIYCIKDIISKDQLHSCYKIRRAFRLITDGTQVRVTQYKDPLFNQGFSQEYDETTHDILMQDLYADWVDEMTVQKYPVGAVLDILIDEMSFNAVCKKWRKRNGWAKDIFQKSLDIYRDIYIDKIG